MADADALLRRIERRSIAACAAMTVVALALPGARGARALGVVAGGVLAWISYRGIRSGADVLVRAAAGGSRAHGVAIGLVKFFTRYAILAAAGYLFLARWRLPAPAVFAGASSFVAAVAWEAVRQAKRRPRDRTGA